ncbi:hypothetical protein [uncultured Maricaulis sp.]|uniref:hypothetical protein n=1 Tax=uncultured Maricaulis sp. TaxID=174710 RepID=UPI0030DB365F|tara:strand:- start:56708 stop:57106 length:399 start_codon:yes stop_codon:yes gene_type:complete
MITRNVGFSLLTALGLIAASLAAVWASNAEMAGPDFPGRVSGAITGLILAVFSNAVAKRIGGGETSAGKAAAKRFMGLALVLGGVAYAAAFLFAPIDLARWIGMGAVITALLVTAARFWAGRKDAQAGPDDN